MELRVLYLLGGGTLFHSKEVLVKGPLSVIKISTLVLVKGPQFHFGQFPSVGHNLCILLFPIS